MVTQSQTVTRGLLNTLPMSQPGGFIPDDHFKREFISYMGALEPRETQFLDKVMKSEEISQDPFFFGRKSRIPLATRVNGALTTGATTINVSAGTGAIFQKYSVLKLYPVDPDTGEKDTTTFERVWVPFEPNADSLENVVRGYSSTTPLAFTDGAFIEYIGVALPQNQEFPISPVNRGSKQWNRFQRFAGGVGSDQRARNMPTLEIDGDPFLEDFEEVAARQKVFLQLAVLQGGEAVPDGAIPTAGTMRGFTDFVATNVVNLNGNPLQYSAFENLVYNLWYSVGDNAAKTWLASLKTASLLDRQMNALRQANMTDSSINFVTNEMKLRTGSYSLEVMRDIPEGELWLVDFAKIGVHPFKGCNWQFSEKLGKNNGSPTDEKYIWGDFSLAVQDEAAMARVYGFSTDPADYPEIGVQRTFQVNYVAPEAP